MDSNNPTATLDTNVLVEFWKDRDKAATTKTLLDSAVRAIGPSSHLPHRE